MKELSKEDNERIMKVSSCMFGEKENPYRAFLEGATYEHPIARKEGFNEALEEVKKVFSPVFQIAPSAENIIPIMEAFKKSFEEIEKLKR